MLGRIPAIALAVMLLGTLQPLQLQAEEILGAGTEFLIGGDLTDPEDDGAPDENEGYDAVFRASDEEGFGGGEFAFNVFDNLLGGGNDKWCCGSATLIDDGIWVEAELSAPHFLTSFTVSSANDVPGRDPTHWAVQGSNDGESYTTIFEQEDEVSVWGDTRFQVIRWSAGADFPEQDTPYQIFRHVTFNTANWPDGAFYQLGEIEFFGSQQSVTPGDFNDDGLVDITDFTIMAANFNQDFSFDVSFSKGDANRDGRVDLEDLVLFREELSSSGAAAASVPEPAGFAMAIGGCMFLLLGRRRRRGSC